MNVEGEDEDEEEELTPVPESPNYGVLGEGRGMYYNRQGEALNLAEWAALLEDLGTEEARDAYKRVAQDDLPNGRWVSTVWLGLNHRFGRGPPLIFETMIAQNSEDEDGVHTWLDYQRRYATEAEALAGHDEAVAWALDGELEREPDGDERAEGERKQHRPSCLVRSEALGTRRPGGGSFLRRHGTLSRGHPRL